MPAKLVSKRVKNVVRRVELMGTKTVPTHAKNVKMHVIAVIKHAIIALKMLVCDQHLRSIITAFHTTYPVVNSFQCLPICSCLFY